MPQCSFKIAIPIVETKSQTLFPSIKLGIIGGAAMVLLILSQLRSRGQWKTKKMSL